MRTVNASKKCSTNAYFPRLAWEFANILRIFSGILDGSETRAAMDDTASAPAFQASSAFAKVMPPIATTGNAPAIEQTARNAPTPAIGSGFFLVAVLKIGPNAT